MDLVVQTDNIIYNNCIFVELNFKNVKRNMYYINSKGDIYSTYLKDLLSQNRDKYGYKSVSLQTIDGKRTTCHVHTLVMYTFKGNPPINLKDPTVDHIDGNLLNNTPKNLRWIERGENSSIRKIKPNGELNGQSVLTESEVLEICDLLLENKLTLKQIGDMYGVEKSTISNIKRKKTWGYLTKDFDFTIKQIKSKQEIEKQKQTILKLFEDGFIPKDIIKKGYAQTTVRRYYKNFMNSSGVK